MSAISAIGSHLGVGAQNIDWSRAVHCGFRGTWLGWTVSSGILTVSVFTSFHLFSLFRFPQTLLLSRLEGNSPAPFWEPRSTRGWDLQNPDCPRSLNHVFSMVHAGIELTLILESRNSVLLSPKKYTSSLFPGWGWAVAWLFQFGKEIWWSVPETTFFQPSLFETILTSLPLPDIGASPICTM